ncbi:hypothetical protein [Bdellovibrio sp. BCCA]|uniref:hypothetical protein n=1 Tax=unclassified Bdellovibrio TaxID=2633795 RepID=UPI0030F117CF
MKALFAILLVSMSVSSAFADGVLSCSGINQDSDQREDVIVIEPEVAILRGVQGDAKFLSYQGEQGDIATYSNSQLLVTLNYQDRTITTKNRLDGSYKMHTNFKCTGSGDDMD